MRRLPAVLALAFLAAPALPDDGTITEERALARVFSNMRIEAAPPSAAPERVELGRRLFFDPRLSSDGTISCAKCHNPGLAWRDGLPRGRGLGQRELPRRAPSLLNVSRTRLFFWDGRAETFGEAALAAIQNPDEMGRDLKDVARDLAALPEYAARFRRAYGSDGVTPERLAGALESFVRTETRLPPSPFDRYAAGEKDALSPEARLGLVVFADKGRCQRCHVGPSFTDGFFHNTGVKPGPGPEDVGRYKVTPFARARRAFKTVPLREVALTGPYMHDGSLKTLRDVVEFYDRGGDEPDERDFEMKPLKLTPAEKDGLVAFLESLTSPPQAVTVPVLPLAAAAPADAPPSPLSRAETRAREAEGALASLGASPTARCRADFSLDRLIRDYNAGKVPAALAYGTNSGQATLEDVLFNVTYRAALAGDPKVCDALTARLVYAGIEHPGAFWCRQLYWDAVADATLTKRSPAFAGACREWLTFQFPKVPRADVDGACAAILAGIDRPEEMCASLIPRYLGEEDRRGCLAEFGRYTRFDRPDACDAARGGVDSLFSRCDDYARFARAAKSGDGEQCGASEMCMLLSGTGGGLPAVYEKKVAGEYCAAVAAESADASRAARARAAGLLRGAEDDLADAESARPYGDLAAARRIDAAAERTARARRRLEAAAE